MNEKTYNSFLKVEAKKQEKINQKRLSTLLGKTTLNIIFLVIHKQMWKVDPLYRKMENDSNFNPSILIIPDFTYHSEEVLDHIEDAVSFFKNKSYQVLSSYDKTKRKWVSLSELSPDLVFFSYPHEMTHQNFYENAFRNHLSCYIPYSHQISSFSDNLPQYNRLFHNLMWKIFAPAQTSLETHQRVSANKGKNVVVTGYPCCEDLLESPKCDPWKQIDSKKRKRIIWAPHHTFKDTHLRLSTFERYADFFKQLALESANKIQFAFKPHPLLKPKLYAAENWGKERTDEYYSFWATQKNTQFEDEGYSDLFLTSDALIHDCGSFLAEYHYTRKPSLYLWQGEHILEDLNALGHDALKSCYRADSKENILAFIDQLLGDMLEDKTEAFLAKHIYPVIVNEKPSDRIINHIKSAIATPQVS